MWRSLEVHIPADHPTAVGHFPGNPIVPGAVLLDEVLQSIAGDGVIIAEAAVRSTKFIAPVRPGTSLVISWEAAANGETKFECRSLDTEQLVMTGAVQLKVAAP
jgi:3-hydroxyacyl-[acyl-carrier-protein] dehydratase